MAQAESDIEEISVAVVGAHLRGMPLNHQLTDRGARFLEETRTAGCYRLYALSNSEPKKPGLFRVQDGGAEILVELWALPMNRFGELVAEVPPPLGFGKLELSDGRWVSGFICEPWGQEGAEDITRFGGFKAYLASLS